MFSIRSLQVVLLIITLVIDLPIMHQNNNNVVNRIINHLDSKGFNSYYDSDLNAICAYVFNLKLACDFKLC